MKNSTFILKISALSYMLLFANTARAQADYEEIGGVVVMEAESLDYQGKDWILTTENVGGKDYTFLKSNKSSGTPGVGTLEARIKINNIGKYLIKWRSKQGGSTTEDQNDSWLRFTNVYDFYAQKKTDSKAYAKGYEGVKRNATTVIPNDKGPGSNGWFKIWSCCTTSSVLWWTKTWDENSHSIVVEFDKPGIYTMEISHRSSGNKIDRILLTNKDEDIQKGLIDDGSFYAPVDAETSETSFVLATSTFNLKKHGISIYPNPAQEQLTIEGLKSRENIALIDAYGRVFPATLRSDTGTRKQLDLTGLAQGLYFLKVQGLGHQAFLVE